MGVPVVISETGFGIPVRAVESGAPVLTVAANGFGVPVVLTDRGAPFVVEGGAPPAPMATIIARMAPEHWDGTELVGEGVTLTQGDSSRRPTVVDGALRFDGTNDFLDGSINIDLHGKAVVIVVTPTSSANGQSSIVTFQGPSARYIQYEAHTAGQFRFRHRSSGIATGLSNFYDTTSSGGVVTQRLNLKTIYVARYGTDRVIMATARAGAVAASFSAPTMGMTSIRVGAGRQGPGYETGADVHEILILEGTPEEVDNSLRALEVTHSEEAAYIKPDLIKKQIRVLGDSISVGISSTPSNDSGFLELTNNAMIASIAKSGLTDAQMSPFGETDPVKAAASFPRVTETSELFTGASLVIVHFGVNDFRRNVPIGAISDTTEDTFYGAMRVGLDNLRGHNPTVPVIMTQPFYMVGETVPNTVGAVLEDYRAAIRSFVAANSILTLNMNSIGINAGNSATFLADGLHPNDAGHQLGRDFLLPFVRGNLSL